VIAPVPPDTEHSTARLVRALRELPTLAVPPAMIRRAEAGYYHDYLSPLAMPEMALVNELGSLATHPSRRGTPASGALLALRQRVIDGEFDASRAESDAWARSPEGQAAFAELTGMPMPPPPDKR
jgi:hypothetical protein